jgi:spore maturation protein CgeB
MCLVKRYTNEKGHTTCGYACSAGTKAASRLMKRLYVQGGLLWNKKKQSTRSVIEQDSSPPRVSKDMLYRGLLELTTFGAEKQISDKDESGSNMIRP